MARGAMETIEAEQVVVEWRIAEDFGESGVEGGGWGDSTRIER